MKKEVILVPKDKCPLDVLAEMGEITEKAWIFLDASAYNKLLESDGCKVYGSEKDDGKIMLKWEATDEYPRFFWRSSSHRTLHRKLWKS